MKIKATNIETQQTEIIGFETILAFNLWANRNCDEFTWEVVT